MHLLVGEVVLELFVGNQADDVGAHTNDFRTPLASVEGRSRLPSTLPSRGRPHVHFGHVHAEKNTGV